MSLNGVHNREVPLLMRTPLYQDSLICLSMVSTIERLHYREDTSISGLIDMSLNGVHNREDTSISGLIDTCMSLNGVYNREVPLLTRTPL